MVDNTDLDKWVEQCQIFENYSKHTKDVCEYLTRSIDVYLTLLESEAFDEAAEQYKKMVPYGRMFKVMREFDVKFVYNNVDLYSYKADICKEKYERLDEFLIKHWKERVGLYYIPYSAEYSSKYVVFPM